jgi:hypothetical protein
MYRGGRVARSVFSGHIFSDIRVEKWHWIRVKQALLFQNVTGTVRGFFKNPKSALGCIHFTFIGCHPCLVFIRVEIGYAKVHFQLVKNVIKNLNTLRPPMLWIRIWNRSICMCLGLLDLDPSLFVWFRILPPTSNKRKPLISTILWHLLTSFIFKDWCKCTFHLKKKLFLCWHLVSYWRKQQDPDPEPDLIPDPYFVV